MALRHKHVTMLARILYKVRTEASKKYENDPEKLAVAYGLVDTIALLVALFLDTELNNFAVDQFLVRIDYGQGVEQGAESVLGDAAAQLERT